MSWIHYKDLPSVPPNSGIGVWVEPAREDAYAYWLRRQINCGAVGHTMDITDILEDLSTATDLVTHRPRPEVLLKVTVTAETSELAERLYHRGCHNCAWDLTHYEPGFAPIPDHVISTPDLLGLLNIGGEPETAWRCGAFWMDQSGDSRGYPRFPGIGTGADISSDLWLYSEGDMGLQRQRQRVSVGMQNIFTTYWQTYCVSRQEIISQVDSEYPHTRRYAREYRRRLMNLRRVVHGRPHGE